MSEIKRSVLFGKLNHIGYKALENATLYCKMRGNPYVELAHWLHQILQVQDNDVRRVILHFDLDPSSLAQDVTTALDKLPRGATSVSDLSSHVEQATQHGWMYSSLMFGESQVRTGHLIVAILKERELRHTLLGISKECEKINVDTLTDQFDEIVAGSPEQGLLPTDGTRLESGERAAPAGEAVPPAALGEMVALARYSLDLTEEARQGKIDPIVGRDDEIRQVIDVLMRRRQNNPILTGEAGVGKTAVAEGFALRIASGDIPPPLRDVSLRVLDLGLLQAGASMKGEFENRLKQVVEEVQSAAKPVILFIDEAHMLLGAGGAKGTGDAANLLKPPLARGTLRTIAATTLREYREIEKDPALERRFQEVRVAEPDDKQAILMMRSMASTMERHHRVQILDEALEASVRLSQRYIPARQLPDKSVRVLDTTCARVAVSLHAVPAQVEDCRRSIHALETELQIIANDEAAGIDVADRRQLATEKIAADKDRLQGLEEQWSAERDLVNQILDVRSKLRGLMGTVEGTTSDLERAAGEVANSVEVAVAPPREVTPDGASEEERQQLFQNLASLQSQLHELQGDSPLILPTVDEQAVASVISDWTGIPLGRMVRNEIEAILKLADTLNERVLGQRHALELIARRIQTARTGLENPNRPVGVFMLCGPSGVGKTETALALAEAIYGGEENVITVNMGEYQEKQTISTLIGAAPGLVGYEEGGALTEPVRRKPYSVVLLDEFEKAHSDVHELFFNVFDKGQLTDAKGRSIDFKNTVVMLTTNVGDEAIMSLCQDPKLRPEPDGLAKALREPLRQVFPAALLGRLVVVPFYPLTDEMIGQIARLQLSRIEKRVKAQHKIPFEFNDEVVDLIVSRCTELESGARLVESILTNTLLPRISYEFLTRALEGRSLDRIQVTISDGDFQYSF